MEQPNTDPNFPQMLYRCPGTEQIHGGSFSTRIVASKDELLTAMKEGWHETTPAALDASKAEETPRAELEKRAAELGIKFDAKTADKSLATAITARGGK